jgi:anhydro-N-acetylmuramic acid kinase
MVPLKAVGPMNGTSLNGVDAALLATDGITLSHTGPTIYRPYSPQERDLLHQPLADAAALPDRRTRPGVLAEAERVVTQTHAETAERLFKQHRASRRSHRNRDRRVLGQTVLHRPASRLTVQIGDGPGLAPQLRIPVAYDFRSADMAAGAGAASSINIPSRCRSARLATTGRCPQHRRGRLDRNTFAGLDLSAMSVADGAAPLTMLTVETIAAARTSQLDRCRRGSP